MRCAATALCVLLVTGVSAIKAEEPATSLPGRTHSFRMLVGIEKPELIRCTITESHGRDQGFDLVRLTRPGEGDQGDRVEAIEVAEQWRRISRMNPQIPFYVGFEFEAEGAKWTLVLYKMPIPGDKSDTTRLSWTIEKGNARFIFSGGKIQTHGTEEAAAEGEPVRIGAPPVLRARTGSRGMQALVHVDLEGPHGCSLHGGTVGKDEVKPSVRIFSGDQEKFSSHLTFG